MKKIFILGSLNMDLVIAAPCIPAAGETLHGSGFMTNPGGKGANQAMACAKSGGHVFMCGCIGNDRFGEELVNGLETFGVNTEYVLKRDENPTGVAVILICEGDNRIILDSGANAFVTIRQVDEFLSGTSREDILLVQLETPIEIVGYALKKAAAIGMKTILNPAPAIKRIQEFYRYTDILVPNETELKILTGTNSLEDGVTKLIRAGIETVVVTLGSKGYCFYDKGKVLYRDSLPVQVVDTTAAGDTFCGALAVKLAEGQGLQDSLVYANRAAALAVTKKGAQASIPSKGELGAIWAE